MFDFIFNAFADFYLLVNADGTFKFCFELISIAFFGVLLISFFVKGYSLNKRTTFCVFALGVCILEFGVDLVQNKPIGRSVALLGISTLLSAIVFSVRVKNCTSKEQREFVKFIDGCLKGGKNKNAPPESVEDDCVNTPLKLNAIPTRNFFDDEIEQDYVVDDLDFNSCTNDSQTQNKTCAKDVDFSHVKSVMERLSSVALLPSDKKQLLDLENVVRTAETTGLDGALKNKINDGLSALLKIMAKYGV